MNISSEIELSELLPGDPDKDKDLTITFGQVPKNLEGCDVLTKVRNQSAPGKFLINIKNIARIYISEGTSIVIELYSQQELDLVKSYVLTRGLSAVAHQKKWTPLHASAIMVNGCAVLFAADSGVGKSTLAGAFVQKGYSYISDDICMLKKGKDSSYEVQPSFPAFRLWADSINMLDTSAVKRGDAVRAKINKYYVSPSTDMVKGPLRVSHVYVLQKHQSSEISINHLSAIAGLEHLMLKTYAKVQMDGLGGHEEQFECLSYLIRTADIKIVKRPINGNGVIELASILEADFLSESE